jgi:hypothetical protein
VTTAMPSSYVPAGLHTPDRRSSGTGIRQEGLLQQA